MNGVETTTREEVIDSMVELVCQVCKEYYYIDQEDVASDSGVCFSCELKMIDEDENDGNDLGQQADIAYGQYVNKLMERM